MKAISNSLAGWLDLVKAYDAISLNVNDRFLVNYEKDFFSDYKVLDDDADMAPFNQEQQKYLEYTLEAFESAIEVVDMPAEIKHEILAQTTELKNKIPTLTKTRF